ncbi:MAG TPA: M28 family metallopeptidase [Terracidiphilus sp.]|nr:M28 family metallopeptidase [Terracidiphilus sp.]
MPRLAALILALPLTLSAQQLDFATAGAPLAPSAADPQIAAALKDVSADRIRADIVRLVDFNNRSTISSNETDLKPGTGVLAASDWIKSQFEAISHDCGNCLQVSFDEFIEPPQTSAHPRIVKPTTLRNVLGILPGTDPASRMILIGGHYDTRVGDVMDTHSFAPGANDDTSGAALVLEAARVLSHHRFPATIVFVAFTGEEQGLNGSHHLAQRAKSEGWSIEAVLNNDIIGGDSTPADTLQSRQRVRVFSSGLLASAPPDQLRLALSLGAENETPSRQLARTILEVGRTYFAKSFTPVMELRLDRFLRGGDHSSFSNEGFAAVRFTDWRENYNHQHQAVRTENGTEFGDLLKFVDPDYTAQVARLNIAVAATLASAPTPPQNVRVLTSNLDNDTILKWDAPTDAANTHYQILWRETAVTDWQYSADATRYPGPTPNSARLPVSKDNVFFGVRACTATGQCSPAVAPLPTRE